MVQKKEVTHTLNPNNCIIKTNKKGKLIYFIVSDDRCSWFYIGNDFTKKTKWEMNSYFRAYSGVFREFYGTCFINKDPDNICSIIHETCRHDKMSHWFNTEKITVLRSKYLIDSKIDNQEF